MTLDELIAAAQELRRLQGGDAEVLIRDDDGGLHRVREVGPYEVHAVEAGNGIALFAWEPSEASSWRRKAVVLG